MKKQGAELRFAASKAWAEDLAKSEYRDKLVQLENEQNELLMQIKELEDRLLSK
jgi:hypothetical protein